MNEIDEMFRQLTNPLAAEGLGEDVSQEEDAPFRRSGEVVRIQLEARVLEILVSLVSEYKMLLEGHARELDRLFPAAYEGEESEIQNAAWALLTGDVLRAERVARCSVVLNGLGDGSFPLEAADDWMRVFNDVRLIATADVKDEADLQDLYEGATQQSAVFLLSSAVLQALLSVA